MSCTTQMHSSPPQNRPPYTATTTAPQSTTKAGLPGTLHAYSPRTMPSPRSSPSVRPTSPLSPGYKTSSHFDTLQLPPQRPMAHQRKTSNGNHTTVPLRNTLKLPSLPRFHPANYPSSSSTNSTPDGNSHTSSPSAPISPRAHQRMYSDAQKQLYFNQREILRTKPDSPRLAPLGSPGPVTPLELEREEGYLVAGARSTCAPNASDPEMVEKLIRAEVQRQHGHQHGRPGSSSDHGR